MKKEAIVSQLRTITTDFAAYCNSLDEAAFFRQPSEKWSVAQNVTHLVSSASMTRIAYLLPKFAIRLFAGRPNRPSRSFDELVARYRTKLEQGGKASGPYVPKPVSPAKGRAMVVKSFTISMNRLCSLLEKNWRDEQLDRYLAPHPLLGKVTLRELAYFTIYHTLHHLTAIKARVEEHTGA